jgi:hypothetical protein
VAERETAFGHRHVAVLSEKAKDECPRSRVC